MYWKCQIYWIELEQICVPLYGSQKDTAVGWNIIFVPFYSWNWDAHLWTSFLVLLCRAWHVMVETKWEVMTITKWLFDRIQQSLCDRPYVMSVSWHDTYLVIILLLVSWNWSDRPTILNSQATLHVMFQYENKTYFHSILKLNSNPSSIHAMFTWSYHYDKNMLTLWQVSWYYLSRETHKCKHGSNPIIRYLF